jgi:hypothetical protein
MANQMIALQARSPQLPDPSRRTAQFVNMMNMARQQEAAERQSALAQQAMGIEAAKEARAAALHGPALTKAQQDNIVQALGIFREAVGDIAEGDVAAAEAVRADLVSRVPGFDKFLPPASTWDRNTRNRLMITSEKEIEKTIATPVASLELSQGGMPRSVTVGGLRPGQEGVYDVPETPAAPRTPTAPQPSAMGREPSAVSGAEMTFGPDETRPLNAYQQEDLRRIQSETGMTDTPASFTGMGAVQMTPEVMSRIVDSAFQTGVMAQVDFDQLLATQPPQNKQALVDSFQRANITLQADAPSLADSAMGANPVQTPESQFAVYRGEPMQSQTAGLRGAPPMEQTLAQTRTSTPLQMRNPNQPIAPGSSVVPLGRLGAEKQVEAQATKDVELRMAPEIAKATKQAERAVELKSTATRAKYATEGILNEVVDRINTIDQLLRNPNRFSIVGPIEGNLPRLLQTGARADAQAAFDKIKNTATLTSLIDMRKSTETGASPVGANPTDKDAKIVEQAASKLIQTGEPATFDAELIDMRRKLYRTYQSAQREYDGVYGEVLKENPKLRLVAPKVSDRYISSKDLAKPRTSTKVDRNNPLLRD